ncbi:cytochrome P450 [Streptomyces umbrinus]|uniref:Cytochrome P450 n=1 Tax=Streptomyces umbrinus TaxID=67370 RepID=A0ABU0T920_9ACTN|nr:cytochrome P450 [Streptomyces umbrinus]MDQ1031451.1 cytochrome P450 [Streptomyces umbrinus]
MILSQPLLTLDNLATDIPGEGHSLRALGPLVPVWLPEGVASWATADRDIADIVFNHPSLCKGPEHWRALQEDRVPRDWNLLGFILQRSALNAHTCDQYRDKNHARLRGPITKTFTRRRVQELRPRVTQKTSELLDVLGNVPPGTVTDLRATFAFDLPMSTICDLIGLSDQPTRERLAADFDALHDTRQMARAQAAHAGIQDVIGALIALKRQEGGNDLTTALINTHDEDHEKLTFEELVATLELVLFAGFETTQNLISNATLNLLRHPDQLALVRSGVASWSQVGEETLRRDGSAHTVMFRYAIEDLYIPEAGVTIRKGDPVLVFLAGVGRDPSAFGPTHDAFDLTRPDADRHRAFGHGMHFCVGAPLARMIASIALGGLFGRFDLMCPQLDSLVPVPSYSSNSVQELPIIATALTAV